MSTSTSHGQTSGGRELARVEQALLARWPESRLEPSLTRISALVDLLGSPQRAMPVIQITGTNGKTTTARMIDELLRGFGLRVGRFTSPHLTTMRERIVLDGEPISAGRFVEVYDDIAPYVQMVDAGSEVPMSFFEIVVAMAYAAFAEAPVDVAVIEVGMGGTWDATNVADARVAVVTPVALDHAEYLGPDVATIATEKAGIIKAGSADEVVPDGSPDGGVVAVLAHQPTGALEALVRRAIEVEATVAREGTEFAVLERRVAVGGQQLRLQGLAGEYPEVYLPLFGAHQAQNAAVALAAVEAFLGAGAATGPIDPDVVRSAFGAVRSPGRLERVRSSPTVLVDAGSEIPMSFFEVMVGLAYALFADAPVDVAVIEVGMGGTWDATNVADARVAVVTPVAMDHAEYLGPDVATIAGEKAGIIKADSIAVLAHQEPGALDALVRRAVEVEAVVAREGTEFGILERRVAVGGQQVRLQGLGGEYEEIFLPLFGAHQAQNAVTALAAVEAFLGAG
ncbi:MAG: folC, partial [Modestobacter sp.]|nr:folC [Modestobacter sp.]